MIAACIVADVLVSGWFLFRPSLPDPGTTNNPAPVDPPAHRPGPPPEGSRVSAATVSELAAIEAREREADETIWHSEVLADACGRVFENFWNRINASAPTQRLAVAAAFPLGEILPGRRTSSLGLPHNITEWPAETGSPTLSQAAWTAQLSRFQEDGWQLETVEFRHTRFDTNTAGEPARSRFLVSAHLTQSSPPKRAQASGEVDVDWLPPASPGASPTVKRIDARAITLRTRPGEPPFRPLLEETLDPPRHGQSIDPLLVQDLDGDGQPEIALAGRNLVYRGFAPEQRPTSSPLCREAPDVVYTAVFGDFDGNGTEDYLALTYQGLTLYAGDGSLPFAGGGRRVWKSPPEIRFPMVLTAGDVDRDGDLDLFLGQYKDPYEGGALPTPYFDANNGNPSFLLVNDGQGTFADATETSGFALHRGRRVYSASFVDLEGRGALDLVTASDFAGLDLYRNDGRGRFRNETAGRLPNPHGFGMAHALSDFDADGRLDLLMIGMSSPTVDRLEHLGLWREGLAGDRSKRSSMAHGNRLWFGRDDGMLRETAVSESIARSGWSWGCGVADFDRDGLPDVFIANGLESKQSVRDYESEYWLHDLFVGGATDNAAAYLYFRSKFARTRGRDHSYGGYEKNRFYLARASASFVEIGHLLGVALEQDSRNGVADDFDGDGRVDLAMTSFEIWPAARQTLRLYRNELATPGDWVGVALRSEPGGGSPLGARVRIQSGNHQAVRTVVAGDSYRSQHSARVQFGVGPGAGRPVDRITVTWADGKTVELKDAAANRYHPIRRLSKSGP